MTEDKIYPVTESDDLFDMDILTERKCPKCGKLIVSHPDCTHSCSNKECDWISR